MNKSILVVGLVAILAITVAVSGLASSEPEPVLFRGPKGATCEVICNGVCPAAPAGWVLSESTGLSGANVWAVSAAAGRCFYQNQSAPIESTETMCCYFQE